MNEVQYEAMQGDAELGKALLKDLCAVLDIPWPTKKDLRARGRGRFRVAAKTLQEWIVDRASRRVYKGTDCGAWLALDANGISVGSIVEGVDHTTETHTLSWAEYEKLDDPVTDKLGEWLWRALDDVEEEASAIWAATHGCEKCGPEDPATGYTPINKKCRSCKGEGVIL